MKFITFIFTYPLIWILSLLPMNILYLKSDFFFFLLYYVIGYRKKTVYNNIKTAFPDKSDKEIKAISKKFFRHFTDLIFESIKAFSISKKELEKRYTYKNIEVLNKLYDEGKSVILTGSHQNNWEWAFGLPLKTDFSCFATYTKIQNPYFDKVIRASRVKFGFDGVPTSDFNKNIEYHTKKNHQILYILLSDQSPQLHKTKYWTNFLNAYVPVHTGADVVARRYNFAVANFNVSKPKRGYYEVEFEVITEDVKKLEKFEVIDKYFKIVENHIQKQPEFYLWSHKRFKHKDKYDFWLKNIAKKTKK